ncbi:CHIT1 [Lemmus lemmus]
MTNLYKRFPNWEVLAQTKASCISVQLSTLSWVIKNAWALSTWGRDRQFPGPLLTDFIPTPLPIRLSCKTGLLLYQLGPVPTGGSRILTQGQRPQPVYLSHLCLCWHGPHQLSSVEWNAKLLYQELNSLKKMNPKLKALLAVGGWNLGTQKWTWTKPELSLPSPCCLPTHTKGSREREAPVVIPHPCSHLFLHLLQELGFHQSYDFHGSWKRPQDTTAPSTKGKQRARQHLGLM